MALYSGDAGRSVLAQAVLFVVASTLALTGSFLGVVALVTGEAAGIEGRLPFYVLALGIAFVGSVVAFEGEFVAGRDVLEAAVLTSVGAFVLVFLGGEGIAYAVAQPDRVVSSQLLFYLLSAGLIGTGVAYWGLNHWGDGPGGRPRGGAGGL